MQKLIAKLPKKFQWSIHNIFAHPLCEICILLGLNSLGDKIHDSTIPPQD